MNIRQSLRHKRQKLSNKYKSNASKLIAEDIIVQQIFFQYPSAKQIGIYIALDEEINLQNIINKLWQKNIKVYCPILHPLKKHHIFFTEYSASTQLVKDKYGISTPLFNSLNIIAPWELDIVLTPLVGFDNSGNRIGMGAGFYDTSFSFRTISTRFETPLIGCAFDCQFHDNIFSNKWDQKLNAILTESGLKFFD